MEYKYKAPQKLKLSQFVEDFVPNFAEIEADSQMTFQSIEAWATAYCIPPNFPYDPATCIPIT